MLQTHLWAGHMNSIPVSHLSLLTVTHSEVEKNLNQCKTYLWLFIWDVIGKVLSSWIQMLWCRGTELVTGFRCFNGYLFSITFKKEIV